MISILLSSVSVTLPSALAINIFLFSSEISNIIFASYRPFTYWGYEELRLLLPNATVIQISRGLPSCEPTILLSTIWYIILKLILVYVFIFDLRVLLITAPDNSDLMIPTTSIGTIRFFEVARLDSQLTSAFCYLAHATAPYASFEPSENITRSSFPTASFDFTDLGKLNILEHMHLFEETSHAFYRTLGIGLPQSIVL